MASSLAAGGLAACGGGGSGAGTTFEIRLESDQERHPVGEPARVTPWFSEGLGRIEPDIGPVSSGVPVLTPVLDRRRTLRLHVDRPNGTVASVELPLEVEFRDRYRALETVFPVTDHATAVAADGTVLVLGGSRGLSTLSDAIDRFDRVTRRFERIGSLRTGRGNHVAVRLMSGEVLVFGGNVGLDIGPRADLVDERTGAVSDGGRLIQPRHRHASTLLADGRVLVCGGLGRHSAELWDPATRRWRLLPSTMAHIREHPSATRLADGRVLIVGGHSEAAPYRFAELFDPRSEQFTPLDTPIVERRHGHHAFAQADGSVLIVGGERFDAAAGTLVGLTSVLRFDPVNQRFEAQAALPEPHPLAGAVHLPDHAVLLFGGQVAAAPASASATAWRADGPRALAAMPSPRWGHTVDRLPDGRLLLLGGSDGEGRYASAPLLYE